MTTAIYPNRVEDKKLVEKELGLEEEGSSSTVFLLDELEFAKGYERIVYGDHGPYIEFSREQITCQLASKYGQIKELPPESYKYFYVWMYPVIDPSVKVYWQIKPVTFLKNAPPREDGKKSDFNRIEGYADYKRGKFYVNPWEFRGKNEIVK